MYGKNKLYEGYVSKDKDLQVNKVWFTLLICAFILGISILGFLYFS